MSGLYVVRIVMNQTLIRVLQHKDRLLVKLVVHKKSQRTIFFLPGFRYSSVPLSFSPQNSEIPQRFPPKNLKIPQEPKRIPEFPKNPQRIPQNSQKIAYKMPKNILIKLIGRNHFRACFY